MHVKPVGRPDAYAASTLGPVVSRAKDTHTPNRVIRVEDDLWHDYTAACDDEGVTRSDDLRAYMTRKARAWKRKQAATGDADGDRQAN
jgi:hypothetical protein